MTPSLTLDTCVIISLVRAGAFEALQPVYGAVAVPSEVRAEWRTGSDPLDSAVQAGWLTVHAPAAPPGTLRQQGLRSAGDWSALALAQRLGTPLATDDRKLRAHAMAAHVPLLGALDILVVLRRAGAVPSLMACLDRLTACGEFIRSEDRRRALRDAGETP